jgi:5,5'-dehydrodivanillate O-demethylase
MGKLLRRFWHPVTSSSKVAPGCAIPTKILGEDLTLYRGKSGKAYLIGSHCAHRRTVLHTGWVEGEQIRCVYHGWCYDGEGRCTERPAEKNPGMSQIRIPGYPTHEYCGFIFAYFGEGEPPVFDLPRKDVFERPGALGFPREEEWPCNWFQHIENSLDPVHVSFVHRLGTFGAAVQATIPELSYSETEAGIRQVATRSKNSVRISDWTFPNHNRVTQPGLTLDGPWLDNGVWVVPIDDHNTRRFQFWVLPPSDEATQRRYKDYFAGIEDYFAAEHHNDLFFRRKYPDDPVVALTAAQDYVAQVGQGAIADRENEILGRSDAGVVFLRRLFMRELELIEKGLPTKQWRRLDESVELPIQVPEDAA